MRYSLLLFFSLASLSAYAQELDKKYRKTVSDFIVAVKNNDKEKIAKNVSYPFKRQYPLPDIKNASEFVKRYDEIFDQQFSNKIINSKIATNWSEMGWRGIMLFNGILWLQPDGRLTAVGYQSKTERDKRAQLIKIDKAQLYPGLRNYQEPVCIMETSTYLIRIDELGDSNYRYASWKKNSKMSTKPDLVLTKGQYTPDGSGGNHYYTFKNGDYSFECYVIYLGRKDDPPAKLTVYKNDEVILSQKALKFRP